MNNRFYLACTRSTTGSCMVWHCMNGKGYSTDLSNAHVYTLEEAQKVWDLARDIDQPVSADHVDALAVYKVDMQKLPTESQIESKTDQYAAFQKGVYDGNDVYWRTDKLSGSSAVDFSQASIFSYQEAIGLSDSFILIPHALADSLKRRTFDASKFNPRTMVQAAGLRVPDHIKRERHTKRNPKTRFNCPDCGCLSWQDNPHDFLGCSNLKCSAYEPAFMRHGRH